MKRRLRLRFQDRVLLLMLCALAPAWLVAVVFLWHWQADEAARWTVLVLISLCALAGAAIVTA